MECPATCLGNQQIKNSSLWDMSRVSSAQIAIGLWGYGLFAFFSKYAIKRSGNLSFLTKLSRPLSFLTKLSRPFESLSCALRSYRKYRKGWAV